MLVTARRHPAALPVVLVTGLVLVEAILVLGVLGVGNQILGGDGPQYNQYAVNLVNHGVFSDAVSAPYFPSVLRTPGYPLFLAALRLLDPGSLLLVRAAQFALLAAAALMLCLVARRLFSQTVALISAAMCATYLPLVWLATYHLTEVLSTFLTVVVVWLIMRAGSGRRDSLLAYALVGAVMAVAVLVRPEYGPAALLLAAGVLAWDRRGSGRRRVLRPTVVLVAFALVMAPWTIRNALVAHRFIPLGVNSAQSLYVSADQYAGRISYQVTPTEYARLYGPGGVFDRITAPATRRTLDSRSENSGVALGTRLELADNDALQSAALRRFGDLTPAQILTSLPQRLAYLWATADYPPPARSFTSVAHRLAQLQWAVIVLMLLGGLVVGLRRVGTRAWPLLLFPVYVTCTHLVFHSEGRYSIPSRPLLMVFAAVGAVWIADRVRGWIARRSIGRVGGRAVTHVSVPEASVAEASADTTTCS